MSNFQFSVKNAGVKRNSVCLKDVFNNWKECEERWLFVAPHDDDLCMGSGLLMLKATEEKIPVRCVITSDGCMGYGSSVSKEDIVSVRKKETDDSFKILGIDDVQWLKFPDCSLSLYSGARVAKEGDPCVIEGNTGIQNAYVAQLRDFKPTRVFVPAGSDLHPDHKVVYQEILISLFHAAGDIWPQLGKPLSACPAIYEMAIYCDFPAEPNIRLTACEEAFEKKIDSILAYKSQLQIETLVNNIRKSGSVEYYRDIVFNLYCPNDYKDRF